MLSASSIELTVRSESVQQAYSSYRADRFRVNRRYQRKLVWSVEEKQRLIDSIALALPLPLFLVAETGAGADSTMELIDGMQRLNAIFSFIEQEYDYEGKYFDLNTLADTKALLDAGDLVQREPVLDRSISVIISNYSLALSVFRAADQNSIDEVFRRINSGGRRLSRQELRQSGTLSPLATMVRRISSSIRGDTSPGDAIALRKMPIISISNRDLDYGVDVKEIFWVKQGILRREDVRESLDEQVVLDILLDCLVEPMVKTSGSTRDSFYSYSPDVEVSESEESRLVSARISAYAPNEIETRFLAVYDAIRGILDGSELRFSKLIGLGVSGRGGRYFHGLFVAIWELMFVDSPNRIISDPVKAQSKIQNISTSASIDTSGDWTVSMKRKTIDAFKGILSSAMVVDRGGKDLGSLATTSQLETLLTNARVEQPPFDCKQGFYTLSPRSRRFDEKSFDKIVKTFTAMANIGRGSTSYVLIGVADSGEDTSRIAKMDSIDPYVLRGFNIVGIEREAVLRGETLNDYWSWIVQKVATHPALDSSFAKSVARNARLVVYKTAPLGLFRIESGEAPVFYNQEMYDREGSSTVAVGPGPSQFELYRRFNARD